MYNQKWKKKKRTADSLLIRSYQTPQGICYNNGKLSHAFTVRLIFLIASQLLLLLLPLLRGIVFKKNTPREKEFSIYTSTVRWMMSAAFSAVRALLVDDKQWKVLNSRGFKIIK